MSGILQSRFAVVPAAGGAYTTWDASKMSGGLALSGSNLIVTCSVTWPVNVLTVAGITGKSYAEFVLGSAADSWLGIANTTFNRDNFQNPGQTANGVSIEGTYGSVTENGSTSGYGPTWTGGDVIRIAVDGPNKKFYHAVNGGSWHSSGDPAAGTGGYTYSVTGTVYFVACLAQNGRTATARFDPASFSYSAPSGYSPLSA